MMSTYAARKNKNIKRGAATRTSFTQRVQSRSLILPRTGLKESDGNLELGDKGEHTPLIGSAARRGTGAYRGHPTVQASSKQGHAARPGSTTQTTTMNPFQSKQVSYSLSTQTITKVTGAGCTASPLR